jgi:hypothetical protein
MQLKQIIDTLKYGELANVYTEEKLSQIVTFINLGLTNLYERFPISEKQIAIQQYPQISLYKLSSEYARTNRRSLQRHKYILDTPDDVFTDDVLFILGLYDEHGHPIPLNDDQHPMSYFITGFDTIQIPNADEHETTFVIYRTKPKYIDPDKIDLEQDVYLPECLLEALTTYVGFKFMQAIGGVENIQLSNAYQERYNQICNDTLVSNILGNNVSSSNIKPGLRGYV